MSLTNTIATMLRAAEENPGQIQRRTLIRGLMLSVKISDGTTMLGISRVENMPSLTEWKTVLKSLPYQMNIGRPLSGINKQGHYVLWAEWPTPVQSKAF